MSFDSWGVNDFVECPNTLRPLRSQHFVDFSDR
jgi:hypothetical protein